MKNKKVWFVTGCSKGLGHALVNELLEQGYMVSATSRSKQALQSWTRMKDIITARMNSLYSLQTGNQSLKNNMEKIV